MNGKCPNCSSCIRVDWSLSKWNIKKKTSDGLSIADWIPQKQRRSCATTNVRKNNSNWKGRAKVFFNYLYLSLSFNLTYQLHKMKYYLKFELYLYILKLLKCFNFNKNINYIFMTSLVRPLVRSLNREPINFLIQWLIQFLKHWEKLIFINK